MQTLPDYLQEGLRLISIGLNPSLPSIEAGFYFANPRNRFWRALNGSVLLSSPCNPGPRIESELLRREGIGFTDVVKRPTRGAHELRAADYKTWAPVLAEKLQTCQPRCAWFHGKLAYTHFLRHAGLGSAEIVWGLQSVRIGDSAVFVTPNPSPANAAYSLDDLIAWYDRLGAWLGS